MNKTIAAVAFSVLSVCAAMPVSAFNCGGSCTASNASGVMSEGVGYVVAGSASAVIASGVLTIEAVEAVSDAVTVVVKASGNAASVTVRLSGKGLTAVLKIIDQT